jgi:transcriptional regulator with XRE-family HTH domain
MVRSLRIKARLTREQVCSIIAMPIETYITLEEGQVKPNDRFVDDISNLYGVDKNHLASKEEVENENVGILKSIKRDEKLDK